MIVKAKSGRIGFFVLLAFLAAGCATGPRGLVVKVDAIRAAETAGPGAFRLVSGMKDVGENDLLFRELSGHVRAALARAGFREAEDPGAGGMAVLFSYGVKGPDTVYSAYESPLYDPGLDYWAAPIVVPSTGTGVDRHMPFTTLVVPEGPDWRGDAVDLRSSEVYTRWFALEAEAWEPWARDKAKEPAWTVMVRSRGTSDDLRRILPLMVRAAEPYLGKDTGRQVKVIVKPEEPAPEDRKP